MSDLIEKYKNIKLQCSKCEYIGEKKEFILPSDIIIFYCKCPKCGQVNYDFYVIRDQIKLKVASKEYMEECVDTCYSVLAESVSKGGITMIEACTIKGLLTGKINMEGELIA